jgi:hypothetical protein
MTLGKTETIVSVVVGVFTILATVGGGAVYVYRLEERVRNLESQITILLASPAVAAKSKDPPDGKAVVAPNPMADACAELARKAADAHAVLPGSLTARALEDLMQKLGCMGFK